MFSADILSRPDSFKTNFHYNHLEGRILKEKGDVVFIVVCFDIVMRFKKRVV